MLTDKIFLEPIHSEYSLIYNYRSHNCVITTNRYVSQITIFPKSKHDDYFYLCISMKMQKIICVYGVTTLNNNIGTVYNVMKTFIVLGRLIASITILFLILMIKNKIK